MRRGKDSRTGVGVKLIIILIIDRPPTKRKKFKNGDV